MSKTVISGNVMHKKSTRSWEVRAGDGNSDSWEVWAVGYIAVRKPLVETDEEAAEVMAEEDTREEEVIVSNRSEWCRATIALN